MQLSITEMKPRRSAGMRDGVSAIEWATREKLAACYRLLALLNITDLTYNHLSARIPDQPDTYLIKGERELFDEVTASSLVKYDFAGRKLIESDLSVSRGGLVIHGGVMEARPDIMAVFHTHTTANMGVSIQKCGLLPLTQHSVRFHNRIGYHAFRGFEFDLDGRERLNADLAGKYTLLMRNHGVLVCGRSIPEAFVQHFFLEMACRAQIAGLAAGGVDQIIVMPEEVAEHAAAQIESTGPMDEGARDWAALIRMVDRLAPSYRE